MTLTVYTGLPGSGKSYESVVFGILPAIEKGRRVVANIDGLDADGCRAFVADSKGLPLDSIGQIEVVSLHRPGEPGFFPQSPEDFSSVVLPGDLVVVDEAYRFWGAGDKIDPAQLVFFREHRHYVSPNGECCDVLMMTQDASDLARKVKVIVDLQVRFRKLKSIGLSSRYSANVFEGHSIRSTPVRVLIRKYESKYFPLYHSYAGGKGRELVVDRRQSIFSSPWLWAKIILVVVVMSFVVYRILHYGLVGQLYAHQKKTFAASSGRSALAVGASGAAVGGSDFSHVVTGQSSQWRLLGYVTQPGFGTSVYLVGTQGQTRVVPQSQCQFVVFPVFGVTSCEVDSQRVVGYAGPSLSSQYSGSALPGLQPLQ